MKIFLSVLISFFLISNINAQSVSGEIHDEKGKSLQGISVRVSELFKGTVSDSTGHFVIHFPKKDKYTIVTEGVGFKTLYKTVEIPSNSDVHVDLTMQESAGTLTEVIVTASRKPEIVDRTPASVQVITAKEFQTQSIISPNISNILAQAVPSLGFGTNTTSNTGQTLRGRNTLIMIDGIPQSTPLRNGSRDIQTIDPSVIERVEVVKGATAIYGNGADGGIINYITKKQVGTKAYNAKTSVSLTGMPVNSNNTLGGKLSQQISGKLKKFDYLLAGTYEKTGVFKDAKGNVISPNYGLGESAIYNVFLKSGYTITPKQRVEVMYNYYGSQQKTDYVENTGVYGSKPSTGIPGKVLGEPGGNRYNHNGYISYQAKDLPLKTNLEANIYMQKFLTVYGYEPTYFENGGQSTIKSDKKGFRLSLNTPFNLSKSIDGELLYGVDILNDKTGQPLVDERTWVPMIDLLNTAPYIQSNITFFENLIFRTGLRYDQMKVKIPDFTQVKVLNSGTGNYIGGQQISGGTINFSALSFNAGLRYAKWEMFKPFVSFSQGFSVIDIGRYVRSAKEDDVTRMQIEPVTVNNYEAGFSSNLGWLQFTGSYFISTNKIGASLIEDNTGWFTQQKAPEKTYGYELSLDVQPTSNSGFGIAYAFVEGKADINKNGNYDDEEDKYLNGLKISPAKASAYIKYAPINPLSLYVQWLHFGNRDKFSPRANGSYANGEGPVKAAGIVNFSGAYKISEKIQFSLGVENLLNNFYYSPIAQWSGSNANYTPANGIRFQAGLSFNW
jgi:iron complex outermembrane receptor protein